MTYDPYATHTAVFEPQSEDPFADLPEQTPIGLSPGNIQLGQRSSSIYGGNQSVDQMLPSMQPSRVPAGDYPNVGKFNIGLGLPAPWVAPRFGGDQSMPTPPEPQLGGQAMGLFEGLARGIENLPGQFLPGFINDHINNLFGLVGSVPDSVLRGVGTIRELPGGSDVEQNFMLMPDNEAKQRYEVAAAADPVNRLHYMAQYLREFEKEWASSTGRNRLMSFADLPSESLGEQLSRIVMGALGGPGMATRRTYVGSAERNVRGTVLNVADPTTLPEDLQYMRQQYLDGQITYDQLLDDIASSRWAWTQDPGLVGSIASLGADILTDPLTWVSFGTAKLASSAATGAIMRRGVRATRLLMEKDLPAFEALGLTHRFDPVLMTDAMKVSRPDLVEQATQSLGRRERNMVQLEPVLNAAHYVANKALDPMHWFGVDRVAGVMTQRMARSSVNGVANALGAGNIRMISERSSDQNRVARALGVYGSNIANAVLSRNLTREVRRSYDPDSYDVPAMEYIAARRKIATEQSEAEDMARAVSRDFMPRQLTGEAAIEASLQEARDFAAKALEDLGVSTADALSMTRKADVKFLATVHALNYGRLVDEFVPARQESIARAEGILAGTDPADAVAMKDATERLSFAKRLTPVGDRELTSGRAADLMTRVKAGDIGAARQAVEQYDIMSHNFRGEQMADDVLLSKMQLMLTQLLDTTAGDRLVTTVNPALLQPALKALFERESLRFGPNAYEVGLAPVDTWGITHGEDGGVMAAHPWADVTNEAGKPWLPSRMDRVRMGMFTHIRGNRLMLEARRKFVRLGIQKGLTHGEADALFHALRTEADRRNVGSRGLTVDTIWQIAGEVNIPMSQRVKIGHRGLSMLLLKAWEGDLVSVGWSSRATGALKRAPLLSRGNFIARVAEDFYPRARFYLSPNFLLQETLEGPFFNIIRGHKPRVNWNETDLQTLRLLDDINTHDRYTDQYEYIFFNQALKGESRRVGGPGTKLERLTSRLQTGTPGQGISGLKQLNYVHQWGREAGLEFRKAIESVQPGLYNRMSIEYDTLDPQEIMLRYFTERGLGRGEDARLGVHVLDMAKDPTLGKPGYILLGDVARDHGFPDTAALREAVRLGRYSEPQFNQVMTRLGAHPEYIKRAYAVASRPSLKEWRDQYVTNMELAGASRTQAKMAMNAAMSQFRQRANVVGVPLEEFLANRFTGAPVFLNHAGLLPVGAFTQHAQGIAEGMGLTWEKAGSERHSRVRIRAREIHARVSPQRLRKVQSAQGSVAGADALRQATGEPSRFEPPVPFGTLTSARYVQNKGTVYEAHVHGAGAPADIIDSYETTLGRAEAEEVGNWYAEMPSLMMAFADMLDETTVNAFLVHARTVMEGKVPDGPGAGIDESLDIRDEMAARMLTLWGATQLNTSPQSGFDFMMRALDTLTHGERTGWMTVNKQGKAIPGYGKGLAAHQMEVVLGEVGTLTDYGLGPKLYDFIDSLLGEKVRTIDPGSFLQPAAIDVWVGRSLGFLDKTFLRKVIEKEASTNLPRKVRQQAGPMTPGMKATWKAELANARVVVMERYGLTDEAFDALPQTTVLNAQQYEWGVKRMNELAQSANFSEWLGRSNWTAADIQAVAWAHAQRLAGAEPGAPDNLFENQAWTLAYQSRPAQSSLHDSLTGGGYDRARSEFKDRRRGRGVSMAPEEMHLIHYDVVRELKPAIAQETGFNIIGNMHASGRELRGGVMPMTALAGFGTEAQLMDAMDLAGHRLQRDDIIATSSTFEDEAPVFKDASRGHVWSMDFKPADQSPEILDALARYVSEKRGVDLDTFVIARDDDGQWVVRGLWLDDPKAVSTMEQFEDLVPFFDAVRQDLESGAWPHIGAALPGRRTPVVTQRRVVRMKRHSNWDPAMEDARVATLPSETPAIEREMKGLRQRIRDMRHGERDREGANQNMRGVRNQVNAAPGDAYAKRVAATPYDEPFDRASELGLDPVGMPGEVIVAHERPARSSTSRYGTQTSMYGDVNEGVVMVRNATGDDWEGGLSVAFRPHSDSIYMVHYTSLRHPGGQAGKGAGSAMYDAIADEAPGTEMWRGIGASGSFSEVGGVYAHDWLLHRHEVLAGRVNDFSTWEWQEQRAKDIAAQTGRDLDDVRAEELGAPYLTRLRGRGRGDLAQRVVDKHAPEAFRTVDDAVRRHAPNAYAHRAGVQQASERWARRDAGEPSPASGDFTGSPARPSGPSAGSRGLVDRGPDGTVRASSIPDYYTRQSGTGTSGDRPTDDPGYRYWGGGFLGYENVTRAGSFVAWDYNTNVTVRGVYSHDVVLRFPDISLSGNGDDIPVSQMEVWMGAQNGGWVPVLDPAVASISPSPFVPQPLTAAQLQRAATFRQQVAASNAALGQAQAAPVAPPGPPQPTIRPRDYNHVLMDPLVEPDARIGLRRAGTPADQSHRYGYLGWNQTMYDFIAQRGTTWDPRASPQNFLEAAHLPILARINGPTRIQYSLSGDEVPIEHIQVFMGMDSTGEHWSAMRLPLPQRIGSLPAQAAVPVPPPVPPAGFTVNVPGAAQPINYQAITTSYGAPEVMQDPYGSIANPARPGDGPVTDDDSYRYQSIRQGQFENALRRGSGVKTGWPDSVHSAAAGFAGSTDRIIIRVPDSGSNQIALSDIEVYVGGDQWAPMQRPVPRVRAQRGATGNIRGALAWDSRRAATMYLLDNPDVSTAVHEAFHLFAEDLDASAKAIISAEHAAATGLPDAGWSVDVEEWAAARFEDYSRDGVAPHPSMQSNFNAFAKYAHNVLRLPAANVPAPVKAVFDKVFTREKSSTATTFDPDAEKVWEASRIALLRTEEQSHRTHFYSRGRNWVERSLNHPYFGLYPLSYMWGKVVPEMIRFLMKKPFGLNAPAGGLLMAKNLWMEFQLQLQTDETMREFIDKHPELLRYIQLLVPGTPFEAPVNLPVVYRRAVQNYLANEQRTAKGEPPTGLDVGKTIDDMLSYAIGMGHFAGQIGDIYGELTGAGEAKPKPKPKARPSPYAGLVQ